MSKIAFEVLGTPQPKGSSKAWVNKRTGRAIVTGDNKKTKPWEHTIAMVARQKMDECRVEPFIGPVSVLVQFRLKRPKNHYKADGALSKAAYERPTKKPDVDKLLRTVLDALTVAGVWRDDAQVVQVIGEKWFSEPTGVTIEVSDGA